MRNGDGKNRLSNRSFPQARVNNAERSAALRPFGWESPIPSSANIMNHSLSPSTSRRRFLGTSLAASAFAGVQFLPKSLFAAPGRTAPNERIRLGIVGCGNRAADIALWFAGTKMVEIRAVCDVDLEGKHCAGFLKTAPDAPRFTDFRKMFDRHAKDFDAVIVGTPDHSHFPVCMLAMSLGKHVYVEKPMAHTFDEIERMMAAAKRHKVVTQMGNQGHSEANYFQFREWVQKGVIKNVRKVDAYMVAARRWHGWKIDSWPPAETPPQGIDWECWAATAPMHDFNGKLHPGNWRSWYDYGSGAFGDWGPHILDTIHEFLDLGLPEETTAVKLDGPNKFIYPQASTISFKFPARGEHPPVEVVWRDGRGNHPQLPPELADEVKLGDAGKVIYADDLTFHGGTHGATVRIVPAAKAKEMESSLPKWPASPSNHAVNFLRACRGEEEARSPFHIAGPLTQTFTLGIIAQRLGGTIKFDRATKKITGPAEAASHLTGNPPRKGWEEFYQL